MVVRVPVSVTDDELYRIGEANPGWTVEIVCGQVVMSPTNSDSGRRNTRLTGILLRWGDEHGYIAFDSSTGFRTGPKDVLSPDAALIEASRWASLTKAEQRSYAPLVPDVVIELLSSPDERSETTEKCARWLAIGASFVVLLDPYGAQRVRTWGTAPPHFPTDWSEVVD